MQFMTTNIYIKNTLTQKTKGSVQSLHTSSSQQINTNFKQINTILT